MENNFTNFMTLLQKLDDNVKHLKKHFLNEFEKNGDVQFISSIASYFSKNKKDLSKDYVIFYKDHNVFVMDQRFEKEIFVFSFTEEKTFKVFKQKMNQKYLNSYIEHYSIGFEAYDNFESYEILLHSNGLDQSEIDSFKEPKIESIEIEVLGKNYIITKKNSNTHPEKIAQYINK